MNLNTTCLPDRPVLKAWVAVYAVPDWELLVIAYRSTPRGQNRPQVAARSAVVAASSCRMKTRSSICPRVGPSEVSLPKRKKNTSKSTRECEALVRLPDHVTRHQSMSNMHMHMFPSHNSRISHAPPGRQGPSILLLVFFFQVPTEWNEQLRHHSPACGQILPDVCGLQTPLSPSSVQSPLPVRSCRRH